MTLQLTFNQADPEEVALYWAVADAADAEGFKDAVALVKNMLWQKFGNKKKQKRATHNRATHK